MDKKSLKCFLISIVLLSGFTTANAQCRWITQLKSGKTLSIVTYGTSLTAGPAAKVWVEGLRDSLLARYGSLVEVQNSGQEAMHSDWGVSQLRERVIAYNPDVVFIEFAINDAYTPYKISVAASSLNLKYMIERLRAYKPTVEIVVQIMNDPIAEHRDLRPEFNSYYDAYRRVAKEMCVKLIDHGIYWRKLVSNEAVYRNWVPDGIHPSESASRQLILPYILKSLLE